MSLTSEANGQDMVPKWGPRTVKDSLRVKTVKSLRVKTVKD